MKRKLFLFIALLACLALPLGHLAAQDEPAPPAFDWDYTGVADTEPNNTPAQANLAVIDAVIWGSVGAGNDAIDYFKFTGQAGTTIAVVEEQPYGYFDTDVTLLRPNGTALALNEPTRWVTLPNNGTYTLGIAASYNLSYRVYLVRLTGDEPNETMATALPAVIGQTVEVTTDYPCDIDLYRFQGRAGDVFQEVSLLLDSNGIGLAPGFGPFVLPADGVYYHLYSNADYYEAQWACFEGGYETVLGSGSLWVSVATDALGGDATLTRGDIATRRTAAGKWQVVFDASDVGLHTANVDAIEYMPDGSLLLSLGAAQIVNGLGRVMPQDIVRFVPTSLGSNTAGTFEWFLDGSDVGLTTSGENIDAISMQADVDNPLLISIKGGGSVARQSGGVLKVADEDVINFVQTDWGANSAGKWRMRTDGSTIAGMGAEDVSGLARVEDYPAHMSLTLMSFENPFAIEGVSGNGRSVYVVDHDRSINNLTDKIIDGLAVGPSLP